MQHDLPSDTALVVAMTRGDREALAEVFRRYGGLAHSLAVRMVGQEQAMEVVRDAFLQLWGDPTAFHPEHAPLRTLLVGLVHRCAVVALRAEQQAEAVELDLRQTSPLLSDLPEAERVAITLAYFHGYPYAQVAGFLRQSERAAVTAMRNGLARLRPQFTEPATDGFGQPV